MQLETTTTLTTAKPAVRLREWAEQLEAQQASGLSVPQYCGEHHKLPFQPFGGDVSFRIVMNYLTVMLCYVNNLSIDIIK